jgi:hypothetical protein
MWRIHVMWLSAEYDKVWFLTQVCSQYSDDIADKRLRLWRRRNEYRCDGFWWVSPCYADWKFKLEYFVSCSYSNYYYYYYYLTAIGLTRWQQYSTHLVDTRWQQYSTYLHTNSTQNTEKGKYTTMKKKLGIAGRALSLRNYTLAFALQHRKRHGKTSVRVKGQISGLWVLHSNNISITIKNETTLNPSACIVVEIAIKQ